MGNSCEIRFYEEGGGKYFVIYFHQLITTEDLILVQDLKDVRITRHRGPCFSNVEISSCLLKITIMLSEEVSHWKSLIGITLNRAEYIIDKYGYTITAHPEQFN